MFSSLKSQLLLLFAASTFNIVIASLFGNDGYEAFITIAIALGVLITWQSALIIRYIFTTTNWVAVKVLLSLILTVFWVTTICGVIVTVFYDTANPRIKPHVVNWPIVLIGTIPYLLPRLGFSLAAYSVNSLAIGWIASMYSVILLLFAAINFYGTGFENSDILLILAIQLQYIVSFFATNLSSLEHAIQNGSIHTFQSKLAGSNTTTKVAVATIGLAPFIIPLVLALIASLL